MPNHFHFLLETPLANISEFMKQFNITYTYYYNKNYMNILSRYIHLNPIRIKQFQDTSFSDKKNYLREFKWSSLPGYIDSKKREPSVDYQTVLSDYGGDTKKGRENYYCLAEDVIQIVCQETGEDFEAIKKEAGSKRQILMEMLYSYAGLKGCEIGELLDLNYSTVSVGRKRLRSKIANDDDGDIIRLVRRIRNKLSIIKI